MLRTLVVMVLATLAGGHICFAQSIAWDLPNRSGYETGNGIEFRTSAYYDWGTNDLWTQANASVWYGSNPNVASDAEVVITLSQTGRITPSGNYNSLRVLGRLTHYASAQLTFVNGQLTQYYKSHGIVQVTSHNGSTLDWAKTSNVPWGTQYSPNSGWEMLVDIPNWDGSPVGLYRVSTAHAKCSRVGINILSERVETTASIVAQGYNR